jgi:SRSO17 transposase
MSHFAQPIRFINQFLNHFQPLFSPTQMNILRQMIYAMFFDYKRLNLSSIAKRTHIDYQKLQYCFSESHWNVDQLNDVRLKILQNQHTTRATANGVMAIDDTSVPKPHAEKTESAQFQYCGTLGRQENCNVAVASCFVSNAKHFPINFKPYIPIEGAAPKTFKSKIDLAKNDS